MAAPIARRAGARPGWSGPGAGPQVTQRPLPDRARNDPRPLLAAQKQLQALDEAAANAQQASIQKKLREARKERDLRSTKAKSLPSEAALAAIAAKRLELAMADEAYNKAEKAKQEARVKLEVMDRDTVVATKEQFRATAKIREKRSARGNMMLPGRDRRGDRVCRFAEAGGGA